ncbi:MAG TPA: YraN family protein [bacterium]|uniref:UPF0102 protein BWY73_00736 n=1 Tax=candidate division TA06 bacterium ADurb.Bin417 TaxID=1852828 RepID=A0A1V5MHM1_UNCT6|nr:MAG: hypothetical protein BWY73_00736 [candidate division TA06 bacterium ADurb.Bin417]HNQ35871.1 YraN family protein [bacterium]HNS47992.1 YraN family protein [bacterium]
MAGGRDRQRLGARGEALAADFLRRRGYRILARNYRTRLGELDLVARHGREIVFIEVRTRQGGGFGTPAESVRRLKQSRWRRAAVVFLQQQDWSDRPCRFDFVGVDLSDELAPDIQLLQNLILPEDDFQG